MKIILKLLIGLFLFTEIGGASEIKVFEFTEAELSQLEVRKVRGADNETNYSVGSCLLYTSPSPRDKRQSRMPSSA